MIQSKMSHWGCSTICVAMILLDALATLRTTVAQDGSLRPGNLPAIPVPRPARPPGADSNGGIKLVNVELAVALHFYCVLTGTKLDAPLEMPWRGMRITIDAGRDLSRREAETLLEREFTRQCGIMIIRLDDDRISVRQADPKDVPVPVGKEVAISLRAVDGQTGAPAPSFRVYCTDKPGTFRYLGQGGDGGFEHQLRLVESAEYTLEVRADGYLSEKTPARNATDEPGPVTVRLQPADPIVGEVLSPDGSLARGAKVFLAGKNFGPRTPDSATDETLSLTYSDGNPGVPRVPFQGNAIPQPDGSFLFPQVPAGEFTLARMVPWQAGGAAIRQRTHSLTITLRGGETNYVTLDDTAAGPRPE
jgi:hypothetical protein